MDDRIINLLNEQRSKENVNLNAQTNVSLLNTSRPLPLNDVEATVSQSEQADKERQASRKYRFYGSIKPIVSNALYNDNIRIFYDNDPGTPALSNPTYNQTGITSTVQSPDIVEKDGYFGYYDDNPLQSQSFQQANLSQNSAETFGDNASSLCQFIPFDPGFDRLNLIDKDGTANYQLKLTYPASSKDDVALITNGSDSVTLADGIGITFITGVTFNDREYIVFESAINHGLRVGDFIKLYNFNDLTPSGNELGLDVYQFKIFKLGDQLNDNKNNMFVLDIKPTDIALNLGKSSFKRVVNDVVSSYYMRVFSAITTEQTEYEIFPAGFSVNSYNDKEAAFNFINDIELSESIYRDNLGRPLTEIFLTITKLRNDSSNTMQDQYWKEKVGGNPFWGEITPGFTTTKHPDVNYNIKSLGDSNYSTTHFENVTINDTEYNGDIVEYNTEELEERNLTDILHRINTEYRENRSQYPTNGVVKEDKKEGYLYKPHYRIKIRDFSSYIESGISGNALITGETCNSTFSQTSLTGNIPDYAILSYSGVSGDTVMKWRDYLDIGVFDAGGKGIDYPFESGAHYIFLGNRFYLKRQDPPCDWGYNDESYTLPEDEDALALKLGDPKYIRILDISLVDPSGSLSDLNVDIRLWFYDGDYDLGFRDVPGGCDDFEIISTKDIDNVC